jgi:phospholipase C
VPLITQSDAEKSFPPVAPPASGQQQMPVQESGTRPHRPTNHNPHADVTVDRSGGTVTATMSNTGGKVGVSLVVFPDKYLAASATPVTVVDGTDRTYVWSTGKTKGRYAFSVYGPDGFVRSFAGTVVAASQNSGQVPRVAATLMPGTAPSCS